jgi:hypothetical protein
VATVRPNHSQSSYPKIYVRTGRHQLGYSRVGASAPAETLETDVPMRTTLYNPGRSACYLHVVDVYSRYPVPMDGESKPQRRAQHYTEHVDSWLRDNPESIKVSKASGSVTRVAFRAWPFCTDLVHQGCADATIDTLIECSIGAGTEEEQWACEDAALDACGVDP